MGTVNLGDSFNAAVLAAAGLNPADYEPATVAVDFVPESGAATIRVTRVASVDSVALRSLIADAAAPAKPGA